MTTADFVVRNIGRLATLAGAVPRVGAALAEIGLVESAALASSAGRIVFAGPENLLATTVQTLPSAVVLDAEGAASPSRATATRRLGSALPAPPTGR